MLVRLKFPCISVIEADSKKRWNEKKINAINNVNTRGNNCRHVSSLIVNYYFRFACVSFNAVCVFFFCLSHHEIRIGPVSVTVSFGNWKIAAYRGKFSEKMIIIIFKCGCGLILCLFVSADFLGAEWMAMPSAASTVKHLSPLEVVRMDGRCARANDKCVRHHECTQMTCKILFRRIFYPNPFQFDTIYIYIFQIEREKITFLLSIASSGSRDYTDYYSSRSNLHVAVCVFVMCGCEANVLNVAWSMRRDGALAFISLRKINCSR